MTRSGAFSNETLAQRKKEEGTSYAILHHAKLDYVEDDAPIKYLFNLFQFFTLKY